MNKTGLTLRRVKLGQVLADFRIEAGFTGREVAQAIGCVESRIRHLESGYNVPTRKNLLQLTALYGHPDRFEALNDLRLKANERGWWHTHRLPTWLQTYIGMEGDAIDSWQFYLEVVPGLLQTEEYARCLYQRHGVASDEGERYVTARMGRQKRLINGDLQLSVVVSEALLWRVSHMDTLGVRQLQRLRDVLDLPNVTFSVLPFTAGNHRSMSGSFTLLRFPEGTIDPIAHQDRLMENTLIDDPETVDILTKVFIDSRDHALGRDESARMVQEFIQRAKENSS